MSRSIAVTGAHGFVGSHLLARLGARAIAIDADVTDADALAQGRCCGKPESRHPPRCASSVAGSWTRRSRAWRVNALGTVNLLEAVRSHAPGARVLIVSTGDVYGQADEVPTPETAPCPAHFALRRVEGGRRACGGPVRAHRLGRRRRPRLPARRPGAGRAIRGRLVGRPDRARRGSRARDGARRRPQSPRRDITDVRDVTPSVRGAARPVRAGWDLQRRLRARGRDARGARRSSSPSRAARSRSRRIRPASGRASSPSLCGDSSKLRAATGWAPTIPLEQTLADALDAARAAVAERMASA